MKKIEPFMWVIFDDDGNYETNSINEFSCGRSGGKPLYTREAFEVLAEAVRDAAWNASGEGWNGEYPDHAKPDVCINQIIDNILGE